MRADSTQPEPAAKSADEAAELALLARLRAGEEAAFAELVAEHASRMLAAARRILRSDEDAQDAFLSAFKALERF